MRRVLLLVGLLAACVPQLATAAPAPRAHVESTTVAPALPIAADSVDTVRVAVVAHIPLPDSLVSDSSYVNTLKNRAVAAVMLGLNMVGVRWTDAIVGLQYAKPAQQLQPTGRSSSNSNWRLGTLARDSGSYARTRLRITRT
jgi:hypothetical protein